MPADSALCCAKTLLPECHPVGARVLSVGKYIVRTRKPPSQTWRTFLANHVKTMVSIDFFTAPRTGSGSVILGHES